MKSNKIRKKPKSVKFLLAPRPQRDPLAADFEAPQHVLVPQGGEDIDSIREKLPDFDPEVFASKEETKTGMLERAHNANGMTFDSDILEAMSKDFDYEDPNNILNDDFMDQAGGLVEDEGELLDLELWVDEPEEGERLEEGRLEEYKFEDDRSEGDLEETKTVFTNYSMTSSVMRRSQGLQQIDDHFERLYEKEYADDTEIGALDLNEVKGEELLSNIDQIRQLKKEVKSVRKLNHGDDYEPEIVSAHHKDAIIGDDSAGDVDELVEVEFNLRENKIDCESILTYNSNLYNHPKLIVEPRKKSNSQCTSDQMEVDNKPSQSVASSRATVLSKLSIRPTNETLEEKKVRKKALKEYRHERRQERKQNQQIFKSEQANLVKQLRTNVAALKLA